MNVFVLSTGRCGSATFARACSHITNYTSAHESRWGLVGEARLAYPAAHIEIDNRLTWLLGRLDERYGGQAFYVHLLRDEKLTAESYHRRWLQDFSAIRGYNRDILCRKTRDIDACLDYCHTVNANIRCFLRDKPHRLTVHLDQAPQDFREFWAAIGAEGNLDAALDTWKRKHNVTTGATGRLRPRAKLYRFRRKLFRAAHRLPEYWRNV